jgi:hypothetical protein
MPTARMWALPADADGDWRLSARGGAGRAAIRRLEELRLAALEARVEANLRLLVGWHADVIGELEALKAGPRRP